MVAISALISGEIAIATGIGVILCGRNMNYEYSR